LGEPASLGRMLGTSLTVRLRAEFDYSNPASRSPNRRCTTRFRPPEPASELCYTDVLRNDAG